MKRAPRSDVLVCCADWAVSDAKRVMACAQVSAGSDSPVQLHAPEPVGEPTTLLDRLLDRAAGAPVLLGLDLPLGLPRTYAAQAGIEHFPGWLASLASAHDPSPPPPWDSFFEVTGDPSLYAPFYPPHSRTKGQFPRERLVRALGARAFDDLLRRCDRATPTRPRAECLFWTLGPRQVGRAAIHAWRTLVIPAIAPARSSPPRAQLWPFDGSLDQLLGRHEHPNASPQPSARITLAEIYPAEAYRFLHLPLADGLRVIASKRDADARRACAPALFASIEALRAHAPPALAREISAGFLSEDHFDALAALLQSIAVVLGVLPEGAPRDDDAVTRVEGWILGQRALPA